MRNQRQSVRRGGRRQPEVVQQTEQRGGRQTGDIGPALGVLNNTPNTDGGYNFNFANDDGSSRQERAGPGGVEGSYSYVSPEGRLVARRPIIVPDREVSD